MEVSERRTRKWKLRDGHLLPARTELRKRGMGDVGLHLREQAERCQTFHHRRQKGALPATDGGSARTDPRRFRHAHLRT